MLKVYPLPFLFQRPPAEDMLDTLEENAYLDG